MKEKMVFKWPDTGKLTVRLDGKRSAKIRFMPSAKVVRDTLRKKRVEAAYATLSSGNQKLPTKKRKCRSVSFLEILGSMGNDMMKAMGN